MARFQHHHASQTRRPKTHRAPRRRSFLPRLEGLEERTVLSTLTVLNALDSGAGSLRHTIKQANDGDTIVFAPSLAGKTITLTSDQLTIKKSLDIEGPGASLLAISGNDANRVFDIKEGLTVTIAGLTITHGLYAGNKGGGGILNVGSTLNLTNDVLSNNQALASSSNAESLGGAITNQNGATLMATGCVFSGNQAIGSDSGGRAFGGAIHNTGSSAVITGCVFTGNLAHGGNGGTVTKGSPFIGHAFGGGIESGDGGSLTVVNSEFHHNQAIAGNGGNGGKGASLYTIDLGEGGGISTLGGTLTVSGSLFSYNQAIGGSNATGGTSGQGTVGNGNGGGISNHVVATVTTSTFDHNLAQGGSGDTGGSGVFALGRGQGGGIENSGSQDPAMTLTATSLTFTNNQAIGGAGGASSNGGNGLGGGIENHFGATLTLSGSTLTGNEAVGGAGGAGGNGLGGGLFNDGLSIFPGTLGTPSTLTVTGSTVTRNRATGRGAGGSAGQGVGGGVYLTDGGIACLDVWTSTHVTRNHASTSDDDIFGLFTICS